PNRRSELDVRQGAYRIVAGAVHAAPAQAERPGRRRALAGHPPAGVPVPPAVSSPGPGCGLRADSPATRGEGAGALGGVHQTGAHDRILGGAARGGWHAAAPAVSSLAHHEVAAGLTGTFIAVPAAHAAAAAPSTPTHNPSGHYSPTRSGDRGRYRHDRDGR